MTNPKNDEYYIEKILTDLQFIVTHMKGITCEELQRNEILLDSMSFRLIQVQENAKKLTESYKATHKTIPWQAIAGLRNRIVHDYGNVNLDVVFDTLTEDVPYLIAELSRSAK